MVSSRHNRPAAQRDRPSFNDLHKYHAQNDLESGGRSTSVSNGRHPLPPRFRFRDAIATTMDMQDVNKLKEALRDGIDQGSLEKFRLSDDELKHIKNKKVRAFYKEQNERLDDWLEVDALVMAMADDVLDSMNPRDLDHDGIAEAGGALQATSESVEPLLPDEEREKRRKARRNAKWAINIMIVSFVQVLQESVEKLLPGTGKAEQLPIIAISAMAATIGLKGLIWFGCIPIKTTQVQALAQDCKTDVYFNTLSLLFPVVGYKANLWWFDPVGAALLSLFIIYDWAETSIENVTRLTGSAADDRVHRKMLYLAYRFTPVVSGLKRVTAYHAGDGIWVEMDVLLEEKTPLRRAHDIAETLQYCCEALGEVDRAFVTTDYATQGPSGHINENNQG
ncbi:hypothetical protein SLS57_004989 [Botryosphaeria dothidea]